MVNYSIVMRNNPMDADAAKKAYASAQYAEVMDINRFAEHIASHGCVYKRADIVAILTMAVDCMREQLLGGQKIQLGDLGDFSISINSIGAESAADYSPAIHVRKLNVTGVPEHVSRTCRRKLCSIWWPRARRPDWW